MNNIQKNSPEKEKSGFRKTVRKLVIRFLVPVCIILLAVLLAKYQMATAPSAQRKKPVRQGKLVTVETVSQTDVVANIEAMGTVRPARQTTLSPEVSGKLIFVSPEMIPGGTVEKGQELFRIDKRDYEVAVKKSKSELATAKQELKLEQGNQELARQEYQMLNDKIEGQDKDLILRKPQLESARASVQAAQANLDKAKLDVNRCFIKAPYNGIIIEKTVDLGATVSGSTSMAQMVGTDEYWLEVQIPVDKLRWINIPKDNKRKGSPVKIYNEFAWDEKTFREGYVLRLRGQLEEQGRMAQLLVLVPDPLALTKGKNNKPRLLIDSYVKVQIQGKQLKGVIPVKREYVHNGDEVWIMNGEDSLEIRQVNILFRDKDKVYISEGIDPGEKIITSDISAPVKGMTLRTESSSIQKVSLDKDNVSVEVSDSNE